jgi:hypothetical protein
LNNDAEINSLVQRIAGLIGQSNVSGASVKGALRHIVSACWPQLPPWSTLAAPVIKEVETAAVAAGVAIIFYENGVQTLLAVAGDHYGPGDGQGDRQDRFMIPGGFINLTSTPGSSLVPPSAEPEEPRVGAAREVEEELRLPGGSPLLKVDPARLKLMDARTIVSPAGERRVVLGMMLELTPAEVIEVKTHVAKIETDPDYKAAVARQSINTATGKPEVAEARIIPLQDLVAHRLKLLHQEQASLFNIIHYYTHN